MIHFPPFAIWIIENIVIHFFFDPRFSFILLAILPIPNPNFRHSICLNFYKSIIIGYLTYWLFLSEKQNRNINLQNFTITCITDKLYQTMTYNSNYLKLNCFNTSMFWPIFSNIRPWTIWDYSKSHGLMCYKEKMNCFSNSFSSQNMTSFCLDLTYKLLL